MKTGAINEYDIESVYNTIVPFGGRYFLWNTRSGDVKELQSFTEKSAMKEAREMVSPEQDEQTSYPGGAENSLGGFFRIMTTGLCNAACPYCYLETIAGHMTQDIAARTAKFISDRYEKELCRVAPLIEWFGGEPLLNPDAINTICEFLTYRDISYTSKITTNGSLWNDERIDEAVRLWNLRMAQITLDGAADVHELVKGFPPGTFNRILWGIHRLLEQGIRVSIRINHFPDHIAEERVLLQFLEKEFLGNGKSAARLPYVYIVPGYAAADHYPAKEVGEILTLAYESGKLITNGRNSGSALEILKTLLPRRRNLACYACDPNNYTIATNGILYNCTHNMTEGQCVGSVFSDYLDCSPATHASRQRFVKNDLPESCRKCALVPVCLGGCPAARMKLAKMTRCSMFRSVCMDV